MRPGVTNLPLPSITTASDGASTELPTATIFPSRIRIEPFSTRGPAAVRIVALRMTVGREGNGVYVLGNGSASGVESVPVRAPLRTALSAAGVAVVDGVRAVAPPDAQAVTAATSAIKTNRVTFNPRLSGSS